MARGRKPKTGTYTGTAAAVAVELGFEPVCVRIYNETDGDVHWEAIKGMTDAHAFQNTNHDTTQNSKITSNGITITRRGFIAGSSLSEEDKVFRYIAF